MPQPDPTAYTHLFVDIGEVLLTNGWDHNSRKKASQQFHYYWEETEKRHNEIFEEFEIGKWTLDSYLQYVIFFQKRNFSPQEFREFIFSQSKPYPQMIALIEQIKRQYGVEVVAVSNESKEINEYRIETFGLDQLIDTFISSCFVHLRKPDPDIFLCALDVSRAVPERTLYLENTPEFIEVAQKAGIQGILHEGYDSTRKRFASFGFEV